MARVATRSRAALATASPQKSIEAFTRTSKAAIISSPRDLKKVTLFASITKVQVPTITTVPPPAPAPAAPVNSRKRKAISVEEPTEEAVSIPVAPTTPVKATKRVRIKEGSDPTETAPLPPAPIFQTPHKPKTPSKLSIATPTSTEKRGTRTPRSGRADSAKIGKRIAKKLIAPPNNSRIEDFFRAIRRKTKSGLPVDFDDLLTLHTAFMRTVVVQIAHNGTSEFLKLREVLPQVSRNWGKRQATIDDMQRIIAIQNYNGAVSPFELMELGPVLCLHLTTDRALDVSAINALFESNLRTLCKLAATERAIPAADKEALQLSLDALSIADLPRAPITKEDLPTGANFGAINALHNAVAAPLPSKIPTHDAVTGNQLTVLQRIRMKEAVRKENMVTSESAAKKATLQRAETITGTIAALIKPEGMTRQSFPVAAMIEKIQDSFPSPIEASAVQSCLNIIAKEIAPEWIKLMIVRGREFVVVQRDMYPGASTVRSRVMKLTPA